MIPFTPCVEKLCVSCCHSVWQLAVHRLKKNKKKYCWVRFNICKEAVTLKLSWHNGHVGQSLAWLPEFPHTLDGLVEECAKNDEDETKKDTEDRHSTLFRIFS